MLPAAQRRGGVTSWHTRPFDSGTIGSAAAAGALGGRGSGTTLRLAVVLSVLAAFLYTFVPVVRSSLRGDVALGGGSVVGGGLYAPSGVGAVDAEASGDEGEEGDGEEAVDGEHEGAEDAPGFGKPLASAADDGEEGAGGDIKKSGRAPSVDDDAGDELQALEAAGKGGKAAPSPAASGGGSGSGAAEADAAAAAKVAKDAEALLAALSESHTPAATASRVPPSPAAPAPAPASSSRAPAAGGSSSGSSGSSGSEPDPNVPWPPPKPTPFPGGYVSKLVRAARELGIEVPDVYRRARDQGDGECPPYVGGVLSESARGRRLTLDDLASTTLSLITVSYRTPRSLANGVASWNASGLLGLVDQKVMWLNAAVDEERSLGRAHGFKVITADQADLDWIVPRHRAQITVDCEGDDSRKDQFPFTQKEADGKQAIWVAPSLLLSLHETSADVAIFLEKDYASNPALTYRDLVRQLLIGVAAILGDTPVVRLRDRDDPDRWALMNCWCVAAAARKAAGVRERAVRVVVGVSIYAYPMSPMPPPFPSLSRVRSAGECGGGFSDFGTTCDWTAHLNWLKMFCDPENIEASSRECGRAGVDWGAAARAFSWRVSSSLCRASSTFPPLHSLQAVPCASAWTSGRRRPRRGRGSPRRRSRRSCCARRSTTAAGPTTPPCSGATFGSRCSRRARRSRTTATACSRCVRRRRRSLLVGMALQEAGAGARLPREWVCVLGRPLTAYRATSVLSPHQPLLPLRRSTR